MNNPSTCCQTSSQTRRARVSAGNRKLLMAYACSTLSPARAADSMTLVKFWRHGMTIIRNRRLNFATDDTWRVLEEISAIREGVSKAPRWPFLWSSMEWGLTFTFGLPNYRHIVRTAHHYSPYEIGATLGIESTLVASHIGHLKQRGYIVEPTAAALPARFAIVVSSVIVSRRLAFSWATTSLKHKIWSGLRYYPGYLVQRLPEHLPKRGQTCYLPELAGPGILDLKHQGRCWTLTDAGAARLRQWRQEESERTREVIAQRSNRRLGVISVGVGAMAVVSIIADASQAWVNAQAFLVWLEARLK